MAILEVVYYGDPRLEQVSEPVGQVTPEIRKLVKDMFETMYFTSGVGLSAPSNWSQQASAGDRRFRRRRPFQTGHHHQSCRGGTIREQKGEKAVSAFPGHFADVTRANYAKVKGLDLNGKEITIEGEELLARALLHEIDHLDGILFISRMKKADREMIVKKMKKQPPVKIDARKKSLYRDRSVGNNGRRITR